MKIQRFFIVLLIVFALIPFISCDNQIDIIFTEKDGTTINIIVSPGSVLENSLASILGLEENTPLFTTEDVKKSMAATGLQIQSVKTMGKMGLALKLHTNHIENVFQSIPGAVSLTTSSASLTLSDKVMNQFISLLPPETADYMELLMAPVFTGEVMTSAEYIDLISAVYGNTLAEELEKATFKLSLTAPTGKKQQFQEKLIDILCGNTMKTYSINWN